VPHGNSTSPSPPFDFRKHLPAYGCIALRAARWRRLVGASICLLHLRSMRESWAPSAESALGACE